MLWELIREHGRFPSKNTIFTLFNKLSKIYITSYINGFFQGISPIFDPKSLVCKQIIFPLPSCWTKLIIRPNEYFGNSILSGRCFF